MELSGKFVPGQIVDEMVLCLACSQKLIDPLVQQLEKLPAACWGKTGFDQARCTKLTTNYKLTEIGQQWWKTKINSIYIFSVNFTTIILSASPAVVYFLNVDRFLFCLSYTIT